MKTAHFLIIAFLTFTVLSCSKNDDKPSKTVTTSELLMNGRWFVDNINGQDSDPCSSGSYFHFVDGNKLHIEMYHFDGEFCVSSNVLIFNYSIDNMTITTTRNEDLYEYTILAISENNLVLSQPINNIESVIWEFQK